MIVGIVDCRIDCVGVVIDMGFGIEHDVRRERKERLIPIVKDAVVDGNQVGGGAPFHAYGVCMQDGHDLVHAPVGNSVIVLRDDTPEHSRIADVDALLITIRQIDAQYIILRVGVQTGVGNTFHMVQFQHDHGNLYREQGIGKFPFVACGFD